MSGLVRVCVCARYTDREPVMSRLQGPLLSLSHLYGMTEETETRQERRGWLADGLDVLFAGMWLVGFLDS